MDGLTQFILFLVGGLVVLAFAGDFLVNGASAMAQRIGVSPLLAGIFIVGFGTSAPEMVVALDAAMRGYPELALGNIVGSNIANVWLVLALPALMAPIAAGAVGQRTALVAMLLATAAWIIVAAIMPLTLWVGVAFLAGLTGYALYTYLDLRAAKARGVSIPIDDEDHGLSLGRTIAYLAIGIIGLPLGANLIVEGGVGLAAIFSIPEEVVGLTLLAIGTSLPEIGAGIAAVMRKRTEILFGNVLGSNLFNILGAGGLVAMFGPIDIVGTFIRYDHWAMAAAALTAALFILTNSKVSRLAAVAMLLVYTLYIYGLVRGWNVLALFGG